MKRTLNGEIVTDLILETFRLNGELLCSGNQITEPHGLTSSSWQVMGVIDIEGSPLTVAQIARRMGLTRQGVQRTVNNLIKTKMVECISNPKHKSAQLVRLSDRGIATMSSLNKDQTKWVNDLSHGFSEKQLENALEIVATIRRRLTKQNEKN